MSELSPAAKTVLNAVTLKRYDVLYYACPKSIDQIKSDVAAALRAAVDQVVPDEPLYKGDQRWMFERDARQDCRKKLLAIADELEAQ